MLDTAPLTAPTFIQNSTLTSAFLRLQARYIPGSQAALVLIDALRAAILSEHQFPTPELPYPTENEIARDYLLRHDWTVVPGVLHAQFVDPISGAVMPFLDACNLQDERDTRDYVAENANARELDADATLYYGAQSVPNDYRIFNRIQADGSYRPLSEFFNAVSE